MINKNSGLKQSKLFALALMAACSLVSVQSHAAYPERPLRIVVPFTPGGGADIVSRQLAKNLSQEFGQTVLVENKPGGSTIIGSDNVAKSPADGYTLLMGTFAHAVNPALRKTLPYKTDTDFAPVAMIGKSPNVLVVSPKSSFKTVQDILTYARENPGKLTFGSNGTGTSPHLAGELFKNLGKVDILHVPYRGAGPTINDLMGGQIDMSFATSASVSGHIQNGQLRAIAVTSAEPSPAYPGVPTVAAAGEPDYFVDGWYGVFVAKNTPPEIIEKLNAAIIKASTQADFKAALETEGIVPEVSTPAALGEYVESEEQRWGKIIKEAGITADAS